jgi:hypothetical protein
MSKGFYLFLATLCWVFSLVWGFFFLAVGVTWFSLTVQWVTLFASCFFFVIWDKKDE